MNLWMQPTEEELVRARRHALEERARGMAPGVSAAPDGGNPLAVGDKGYLDQLLANQEFMGSMEPQDAQKERLERQQMMAEALMGSSAARQATSPVGAALSGIADIINASRGAKQMRGLEGQRAELDAATKKGAANRTLLQRAFQGEEGRVKAEREAAQGEAEAQRSEAQRAFREAQARAAAESRAAEAERERQFRAGESDKDRAARAREGALGRGLQRELGRAPGLTIITGQDGAQFFVDPRNPKAPAVPVTGPDGQPITKPSQRDADMEKRQATVRDIEERARNMDRYLGEMERLIDAGGTYDLTGPHNALLEAAIKDYSIDAAKMRDPTSVAREGEVEMEKKSLFNVSPIQSDDTARAIIKEQRRRLQERRAEAYRTRGLEAPEPAPVAAPGGLSADKQRRLEELRRKRAAGELK